MLPLATGLEPNAAPYLNKICTICHYSRKQEGRVNLLQFQTAKDLTAKRYIWETFLRKIETAGWVEKHFAAIDRNTKPDPGRLNRMECRNTIRLRRD